MKKTYLTTILLIAVLFVCGIAAAEDCSHVIGAYPDNGGNWTYLSNGYNVSRTNHMQYCTKCEQYVTMGNHTYVCTGEDQTHCGTCGVENGDDYYVVPWHLLDDNAWEPESSSADFHQQRCRREGCNYLETGAHRLDSETDPKNCTVCGADLSLVTHVILKDDPDRICLNCGRKNADRYIEADNDPTVGGDCQHLDYTREITKYGHRDTCKTCGTVFQDGDHSYDCQKIFADGEAKTCSYCGASEADENEIHVDHSQHADTEKGWIPESNRYHFQYCEYHTTECARNGEHSFNEAGICRDCNYEACKVDHDNPGDNAKYVKRDDGGHDVYCASCNEHLRDENHSVLCNAEDRDVCADCGAEIGNEGVYYDRHVNSTYTAVSSTRHRESCSTCGYSSVQVHGVSCDAENTKVCSDCKASGDDYRIVV